MCICIQSKHEYVCSNSSHDLFATTIQPKKFQLFLNNVQWNTNAYCWILWKITSIFFEILNFPCLKFNCSIFLLKTILRFCQFWIFIVYRDPVHDYNPKCKNWKLCGNRKWLSHFSNFLFKNWRWLYLFD